MDKETKETTEDAVEALAEVGATWFAPRNTKMAADAIIKSLAAQGYTLRRETMTEAELEREALELAKDMFEWTDSANASFIVGLVKKYAGRV